MASSVAAHPAVERWFLDGGDGEYRSRFFDLLIDDLKFTVLARNRYRAEIDGSPRTAQCDQGKP